MKRWLTGLALITLSALPLRAETVTVFAAASLGDALAAISDAFSEETEHATSLSLAGSSALARQIEAGAPAQVFISANPAWMDHLQDRQLIAPASRRDIAGNRLAIITHGGGDAGAPAELPGRLGQGRLAMALVDAVPAGLYGKAALEHFGLWDQLASQVAQTDNVRAALALVALGAAPFGIVYTTDALAEPRVSIFAVFPPDSHPPIRYPAAIVARHDTPAGRAFLDFLSSPQATDILTAHGFGVAP